VAIGGVRNLMSRKLRRRKAGAAAVVVALASLGGLDVTLVTSHGAQAPELAVAAADQVTPVASSQVVASPSQPGPAGASPAVTVPAPTQVTETPPPVVDGVKRVNVGSAHSPRLLQQLATSPATMPPPADAGALGVDVADYQHSHGAAIDWPQVAAAGYKFAFVKATEGDYYANPYYASDLAQAKAAGLYATGYHFAIPNVSDGASQADYALANGGYAPDGRTLPLALDIEYNPYGAECYGLTPAQLVSWISAFTAEVQRVTSQQPIIYTTADWWDTCTGDSTAFGADTLWVAGYVRGTPPIPAGWGNWTFWQYTSRGNVPGITGSVDVSYFLQAAVRLLDPGNQQDAAGTAIKLQVTSLNAADGQSPQFAASGLPPGLSISSGGLIAGTISSAAPAASAAYQVTIAATSPSGNTGSVSFVWTVTPASPPGSASPAPTPTPSPTSTPTPTSTDSGSPSPPTGTAPASPTATDSATASPTASDSAAPTPTDSTSPAPAPTGSVTPTPTPTLCVTPTPTGSVTPTDTATPTSTPTDCATPTPTTSASPTGSASPSAST
jgi:GH25 family lysozyme M1 (1,4-beta-N-acetylmuramidase)